MKNSNTITMFDKDPFALRRWDICGFNSVGIYMVTDVNRNAVGISIKAVLVKTSRYKFITELRMTFIKALVLLKIR